MKLKKIASLALAGIMAVSMLAGCSGSSSSNSTEEPDVTPVTGAAAIVNEELDVNKDKIAFTDNEVVSSLLKSYFAENPVDKTVWSNASVDVVKNTTLGVVSAINSVVGSDGDFGQVDNDNYSVGGTYSELYVLNSEYVSRENALRMVGQHLDDVNMPTEGNQGTPATASKSYSYTGTISAVEAESKGGTESVWIVVATITRTVSDK